MKLEDEEETAKAIGMELRISPKWSVEVCREIRGKDLFKAKALLEDFIAMKKAVPVKRYKGGVAHRKGLQRASAGRYPVKTADHILTVLESAQANAEYKGLDPERLYVKHISTQMGRTIRGFRARAYGRATPNDEETTNIQVILEER